MSGPAPISFTRGSTKNQTNTARTTPISPLRTSACAFASVDLYNADCCDDAIIYTETFEPRLFTFDPTVSQMGLAIGNVAAHEAGHLLGLNHVDDDRALMDGQSPTDVFVSDQEFIEAPLSGDVMAIGTQDAVLLLSETVGLLR